MANKVTKEDIVKINVEYLDCHVYAEVARRTGFSASTVKKYIDPNFSIVNECDIKRYDIHDTPIFNPSLFEGLDNYGDLCKLSDAEIEEIKELWKEIEL